MSPVWLLDPPPDLAGYVRDYDPDGGERDEDSYDLDDHDFDDEFDELSRRSGSISRL
jgi:hypothetical protein